MSKASRKGVYIAPDILQLKTFSKASAGKLVLLKYIIDDIDEKSITISSDTDNVSPETVKWCYDKQQSLLICPTKAERDFMLFVRKFKRIRTIFQKPFYICGQIYFADCYLPEYKCIIEIDGAYHNADKQKIKDKQRTIFLNSVGINVIRVTNEEAMNHMNMASILYRILYGDPK